MSLLNQSQRAQFSDALTRVGGDEEILIALAEMAVEDAPPMLDQLQGQVQAEQWGAVAQTAHALKGLLSAFETGPPVEELQPLIDAARSSQGEAAHAVFGDLRPSLQSLVGQVRRLTESTESPSVDRLRKL